MIKNRIVAAIAALVLAVVGTVLVVNYVVGADRRALEGVETVDVLVVTSPVPAGTPANELDGFVDLRAVPARVVPSDAVSNVSELGDSVAAVALVPGEQVLLSRFVDPADLGDGSGVELPEGTQQVSIALDAARAGGGSLVAGDTVGVYTSLISGPATGQPVTHLMLNSVLVTRVAGGPAADAEGTDATSGTVMVTLAVSAADAEKLVFATEFAAVWLSNQPGDADDSGTRELTSEGLFQ